MFQLSGTPYSGFATYFSVPTRLAVRRLVAAANRGARKNDQLRHLPRIQRQFQHALVVDDLTDACGSGLDQGRVGLNFDRFRHLTDFQYRVYRRIAADLQNDSRLNICAETVSRRARG